MLCHIKRAIEFSMKTYTTLFNMSSVRLQRHDVNRSLVYHIALTGWLMQRKKVDLYQTNCRGGKTIQAAKRLRISSDMWNIFRSFVYIRIQVI